MIRSLWTQEKPAFEGQFWSFSGIDAQPRPTQTPSPPIVIGGHSAAAHRRAVRRGDGWYGFALDVEATRDALEGLGSVQQETKRPDKLGELEISITPPATVTAADVQRYAELGVDRLILLVNGRTVDDSCERIASAAETLLTA